MVVGSDYFFGGDPCPGIHKYFRVGYKCLRGTIFCQRNESREKNSKIKNPLILKILLLIVMRGPLWFVNTTMLILVAQLARS